MKKIYKFYKVENNQYGSDYCFCQRPCSSNYSLDCFMENGEILGFMSESLVSRHDNIKEIDLNTFMYEFVRPMIKELNELKVKQKNKKEYDKAYREAHKEEMKKYREAHKEEMKKYREAHKEEDKKYKKKYRETHKEKLKEYSKKYRETHKEKGSKRGE